MEETMFTWLKNMLNQRFRKPKEEDQKRKRSEEAFNRLHIDYGIRSEFMYDEPLSRERYESNVHFHYGNPPHYDEYLRLFEEYKTVLRDEEYWSDYYRNNLS